MSNIPFHIDLQQDGDAIDESSKPPRRQSTKSYKTAESQQFTNFDSTNTADQRQSGYRNSKEQGYDNNVRYSQHTKPEQSSSQSWKGPMEYASQGPMTPNQRNINKADEMHENIKCENVTQYSVRSNSTNSSVQNSVDSGMNPERNVENGPSYSNTSNYENDLSKRTHTKCLPTNKTISDKNESDKGVALNIITPKRRYKFIFTNKTDDNRIKAEKLDLPATLAAGEYLHYPSPNDSNIKVTVRPNPPKNVENGKTITGQAQTLQTPNGGRQEQERENASRRHVPETVLCLDISENMEEQAFKDMVQVAKTFVTAMQALALGNEKMLHEKIGIATFGHETKVVMHLTDDYEGLITKIESLTHGGACSMENGLMMAQAAFSNNCQPLISKIIIISNGRVTPEATQPEKTKGTAQAALTNTWSTLPELIQRGIRVYCIPVGEARLEVFEEVTEATGGKIIQKSQIHKVVKLTWFVYIGFDLAANFDHTVSRQQRKDIIRQLGYTPEEDDLECILDQIEFINTKIVEQDNTRQRYDEFDPSMPESGSRVKRGPHWRKGNHDTDGVGTVIGHHKRGVLCVEWDNGDRDRCNYTQTEHEVVVVNEPRALSRDEMIAVGCIVKRGINWNHGDFDGGQGNTGVVLRVVDDGTVLVRWQNKEKHRYKFGYDGIFEVEVCAYLQTTGIQPAPLPPRKRGPNHQLYSLDNVEVPIKMKQAPVQPNTLETVEITWQYQKGKDGKEWIAYEKDTQEKIEWAYKQNRKAPLIRINNEDFRVVFADMTLLNRTSKEKVKTRRCLAPIRR